MINWLFGWAKTKTEPEQPKNDCKHKGRWTVLGTNTIGFGCCLECDSQVNLGVLIANSADRMNALLAAMDSDKHERIAGMISDAT